MACICLARDGYATVTTWLKVSLGEYPGFLPNLSSVLPETTRRTSAERLWVGRRITLMVSSLIRYDHAACVNRTYCLFTLTTGVSHLISPASVDRELTAGVVVISTIGLIDKPHIEPARDDSLHTK